MLSIFLIIDTAYLAVAAAVLVILLAHGWLIRRNAPWPALIVPALYVLGVGYLAASGLMRSPLDYLFAAFGLAGLLLWRAQLRRRQREVHRVSR